MALDEIFEEIVSKTRRSVRKELRRSRPSSPPPRPTPAAKVFTGTSAFKEAFRREVDPDDRPRASTFSTESAPSWHRDPIRTNSSWEAHGLDTKQTEATLSLNVAKACVVFRAVYSEAVVNLLKSTIPAEGRLWNDRDGVWEINPKHLESLKGILKDHYKDVQVVGVPKVLPATKFDKLMAKLDKDDRAKIYRLLAAKYHPDVVGSGSGDTMMLINEVFK